MSVCEDGTIAFINSCMCAKVTADILMQNVLFNCVETENNFRQVIAEFQNDSQNNYSCVARTVQQTCLNKLVQWICFNETKMPFYSYFIVLKILVV